MVVLGGSLTSCKVPVVNELLSVSCCIGFMLSSVGLCFEVWT